MNLFQSRKSDSRKRELQVGCERNHSIILVTDNLKRNGGHGCIPVGFAGLVERVNI